MATNRTKSMWIGLVVFAFLGGVVSGAEECVLKLPYIDSTTNKVGPAFEIGNAYMPWLPTLPVVGGNPLLPAERYGIEGWYEYTYPVFVVDPNVPSPTWPKNTVVDPNGFPRAPGYLFRSYKNTGILGGHDFGVSATAEKGTGIYAKGGPGDYAGTFEGKIVVEGVDCKRNGIITRICAGLDYAEGFDVSDASRVTPGTVLVIDPLAPGKLAVSQTPYDTKVAGIAAGAKGLGSGVRLGVGRFDHDVALAGRVYCNVDATRAAVRPGDLLTTAAEPGYAMKVTNHGRAQGAILGKAMEGLEKGRKGQILVLVTLQ
jgi:hypothetical protein